MNKLNHLEIAKDRLLDQYKNSTNLINYIDALLSPAQELEDVINDLLILRWIDSASGYNLDVLGEIVGQPRTVYNAASLLFFGFNTAVNSGTYGDETDPAVGERFRAEGEEVTGKIIFSDPEYRILIKGKILSNRTDCTVNNIENISYLLFGARTRAQVLAPMQVKIRVYKEMDSVEKTMIGIALPRPTGVLYTYEDDNGAFASGT